MRQPNEPDVSDVLSVLAAAGAVPCAASAVYVTGAPLIKNCNLVPKGQWGKWSAGAKGVFNDLYSHMIMNQWAYLHPKQEAVADEHWATICWNASWMAACAADEAIPDIV